MSRRRIEEMLAEAGLDPVESADVADALAPMADLVDRAPAPSAELSALFAAGTPVRRPASFSERSRSTLAGVVVLAVSSVGATGLSAAANTLPRPFQHQVSQFSQHYLPFDLPEPSAREPRQAADPGPDAPKRSVTGTGSSAPQALQDAAADLSAGAGAPDRGHGGQPGDRRAATSSRPGSEPSPRSDTGTAAGSTTSHHDFRGADESPATSSSAPPKPGPRTSTEDWSGDEEPRDRTSNQDRNHGKDKDSSSVRGDDRDKREGKHGGKNHGKNEGNGSGKNEGKDPEQGADPGPGQGPEAGNDSSEGQENEGGGQEPGPPTPQPDPPEPRLPQPETLPGPDLPGVGPQAGG